MHFAVGDITRTCRNSLRLADQPITAHEMAVKVIYEKGLDTSDPSLLADFTTRFAMSPHHLLNRRAVTKQGRGASARWTLTRE